jgi:hypothetical protein
MDYRKLQKISFASRGYRRSFVHVASSRIVTGAGFIALLVSAGCGMFGHHYPLGKLSVLALEAGTNKPVQGEAVDLYKLTPKGKVYWRGSYTSRNGIAVLGAKDGGVIEGNYVVHISDITWHKLAPGEANDRPVTIRKGDDTVLTFRVVQRLPYHPSPKASP